VTPVLELSSVIKDFHGLRPLRIHRLVVEERDQVALLGLDQVSAEIFINLLTGASLPDSGEIHVFGRPTSSITDSAEWMTFVDRFGIVSERAVLLDGMSVIQNLSVPFSLEIEPPPADVRSRAAALAQEVGLSEHTFDAPVGGLNGALRTRVRLGRALALDPSIIVLEHPSAGVPRDHVATIGRDVRAIVARRAVAALTLTADPELAETIASRVLTLEPSSGRLNESRTGWLSRLAKKTRRG